MTTPQAAAAYEAQHILENAGKGNAIYNPQNRAIEDLPRIYGFNNGGSTGWLSGQLIAEDGTGLGGHICSSESYMPHDLGILEGTRQDRHDDDFKKHYPDGYVMEFVSYHDVSGHEKLQKAFALEKSKEPAEEAEKAA